MHKLCKINRASMASVFMLAVSLNPSILLAQDDDRAEPLETDCLLMVLDQVDLAAQRDGVLEKLSARMGEDVAQGQLLVELSDRESRARLDVARAELEQAKVKADNPWNIKAAEAELRKSTKEDELLTEVGRTPYLERFRAANTKEKNSAELKVAQATHREDLYAMEVAAAELDVAQIDLDSRSIKSPVSGTIVRQYRHEGEWCRQGDPVIKILRMDRLMVQAIVNIRDIAPHKSVGLRATAAFRIAGEEPIVMDDLTITRCSPEVDLDGNYLVWTLIDNRQIESASGQKHWLLRPGISGTLAIDKPSDHAKPKLALR